jgi:hypothetical protein
VPHALRLPQRGRTPVLSYGSQIRTPRRQVAEPAYDRGMAGAEAGPDLLESGGPDRAPRDGDHDQRPGAGTQLLQRHRRLVTWGSVVVVAIGYLSVQWYQSRRPVPPPISVKADRSPDSQPLWSAGVDGRPTTDVTLSVAADLALAGKGASNAEVTPLGLSGPGLSAPGVFPHGVLTRRAQSYDLTGQVACDHVTLPVSGTAYQMRARVRSGSNSIDVDMPLPLAGPALAQRVTYGCSTWLAARDLTVTAADAVVDPSRPHLVVTVRVANAGAQDALVWLPTMSNIGVHLSDLVLAVPGKGTAQASVTVDLDTCWDWLGSSAPLTTTDTPLPLMGGIGLSEPLPSDAMPPVQALNGIVLGPGVATTLQNAFVTACGGVANPELATGVHSSRYIPATQSLTTTALVDVPIPAVQRVRLVPVLDSTYNGPATPRYQTSPWLTPDEEGRTSWPLSYSISPNIVCITGGGGVWVSTNIEAQVPNSTGGVRIVMFRLAAEALLPAPQIRAACDAMDAASS